MIIIEGSNCADLLEPRPNATQYFNDGYLLRSDREVFIISKGLKRPFPNAETFDAMNFSFSAVKTVPQYYLDEIPTGDAVEDVLKRKN